MAQVTALDAAVNAVLASDSDEDISLLRSIKKCMVTVIFPNKEGKE